MIRAILAVIVGYVVWTVIWLAGGLALMPAIPDQPNDAGVYNDSLYLGISLVLSVICSIVCGIASGKIARRAMHPAVIVTALLLLLTGIGVQGSAWSGMPVWYHVPFLLMLVPFTLLGAKFGARSCPNHKHAG